MDEEKTPDSWDLLTEPIPLGGVPLDPAARAAVEATERELAEIFSGVEIDGSGQAPHGTPGAALPGVRLNPDRSWVQDDNPIADIQAGIAEAKLSDSERPPPLPVPRVFTSQAELDVAFGVGAYKFPAFAPEPRAVPPETALLAARRLKLALLADQDSAVLRLLERRTRWYPWDGSAWWAGNVQLRRRQVLRTTALNVALLLLTCAVAIGVTYYAGTR